MSPDGVPKTPLLLDELVKPTENSRIRSSPQRAGDRFVVAAVAGMVRRYDVREARAQYGSSWGWQFR
jgi:hypothetical protein